MKTRKQDCPERRCIVTGSVLPKEKLIRCVVSPDGLVVPDVDGKLPGRGLWLSAARDVVNTACAKNAFSRAARQKVKPMDGLADRIEALLVQRCLSLIGMMKRSGGVIYGFEKTRGWLKDGKCIVVLAARDGADDGRAKIKALSGDLPLIELFDSEELGGAVGRDHLVHMGFAPGQMAKRFQVEALRLQGFREKTNVME
ncbi:RNA-binding protein [Terasakiella sp. SH-1]|uniref:RNA-binding protein n=1 Tax=Terasakiella sp. SH-1 TaxID=2560057 RepID=UPI001073BD0D|nr:RNA-binding protein [Terasakiella sp. SH-1]